jgi:hypothetical protein
VGTSILKDLTELHLPRRWRPVCSITWRVTYLACIWEVPSSNPSNIDRVYSWFLHPCYVNAAWDLKTSRSCFLTHPFLLTFNPLPWTVCVWFTLHSKGEYWIQVGLEPGTCIFRLPVLIQYIHRPAQYINMNGIQKDLEAKIDLWHTFNTFLYKQAGIVILCLGILYHSYSSRNVKQ